MLSGLTSSPRQHLQACRSTARLFRPRQGSEREFPLQTRSYLSLQNRLNVMSGTIASHPSVVIRVVMVLHASLLTGGPNPPARKVGVLIPTPSENRFLVASVQDHISVPYRIHTSAIIQHLSNIFRSRIPLPASIILKLSSSSPTPCISSRLCFQDSHIHSRIHQRNTLIILHLIIRPDDNKGDHTMTPHILMEPYPLRPQSWMLLLCVKTATHRRGQVPL